MKLIRILTGSTLLLASVSLYAETSENTKNRVDNACLRQAVSLVNKLKSEVYTDMNSKQSNKIVKLATATCRKQFSKIEAKKAVAEAGGEKQEVKEKKSDDSFTDYILSGETADKDGNKRLKRK